jgi:hypothetical protein
MKYIITLAVLLLSNLVLAEGRIELSTEDEGGVRWLDFYGENIPAAYGMELEVLYPSSDLSIVDVNDKKSGPQILKGDFFSESSYEVANNVDVRKGRIRYAVSLLKPAEPVAGRGHLARIGFINKSDKAIHIELSTIKFGTQSGQVIEVSYPAQVLIEPALSAASSVIPTGFKPAERKLNQNASDLSLFETSSMLDNNMLIIGLLSVIGLLLLIVIILLFRRQPLSVS